MDIIDSRGTGLIAALLAMIVGMEEKALRQYDCSSSTISRTWQFNTSSSGLTFQDSVPGHFHCILWVESCWFLCSVQIRRSPKSTFVIIRIHVGTVIVYQENFSKGRKLSTIRKFADFGGHCKFQTGLSFPNKDGVI